VRSKRISTLPRQAGQEGEVVVSVAIVVGIDGSTEYNECEVMGIDDVVDPSIVRIDGWAEADACEGGGRRIGWPVDRGGGDVIVEGSR
jgi:hypothetical protein